MSVVTLSLRNGFYIFWLASSSLDKDSGEQSRAHGLSCYKISVFERLVSNGFDPDQAQHYVGPDLGPDCLQRISSDTWRQRVKSPL